jgi:hypothetical protein
LPNFIIISFSNFVVLYCSSISSSVHHQSHFHFISVYKFQPYTLEISNKIKYLLHTITKTNKKQEPIQFYQEIKWKSKQKSKPGKEDSHRIKAGITAQPLPPRHDGGPATKALKIASPNRRKLCSLAHRRATGKTEPLGLSL